MIKFNTKSKDFIDAVSWVTKNYDVRNEKSYVVFSLDKEGNTSISHENRASFMKAPLLMEDIDLDGSDEVKVAVDGNFLKRLAPAVKSSESLKFSWEEGDAGINIETSNATFTLPIMDFTIPADMKITVLGEVDDNDYFDAIQRLAKLCTVGDKGFFPALEAVDLQFNVDKKSLTIMATDKYTLGEISLDFEPNEDVAAEYFKDHEHIFLLNKIAALIQPTKDSLASVSIINGSRGDKYGYSFADGKIALFYTQEAEPIKYHDLKNKITENAKNHLIVKTKELEKAISIVSSLAWNETTIILDITEDELFITDNNKQNTFDVVLEEVSTDKEYKVKFIRSIINNAFSPISTENVKISWKDRESAFTLTPVLDNGEEADNVFVFCVPSTRA